MIHEASKSKNNVNSLDVANDVRDFVSLTLFCYQDVYLLAKFLIGIIIDKFLRQFVNPDFVIISLLNCVTLLNQKARIEISNFMLTLGIPSYDPIAQQYLHIFIKEVVPHYLFIQYMSGHVKNVVLPQCTASANKCTHVPDMPTCIFTFDLTVAIGDNSNNCNAFILYPSRPDGR